MQIKKRSMHLVAVVTIMIFVVVACRPKSNELIVAKVYDKYLYFSDIEYIFPDGCSLEDSLSLAKLFINNWIQTQLLLNKAEINLTEQQLNVSKEIEAYRSSLLIYKYKEQMVQEKLKTIVSEDELEKYYNAYTANFVLGEYAIKAFFVILPKDAPNLDKLKKWYTSEKKEDFQDLVNYCYQYAKYYSYYNDDWVTWSTIQKELPQLVTDEVQLLRQVNNIEQTDDESMYIVLIKDKIAPGQVAPFVIVRDQINEIIINKRKLEFINNLEQSLYNDALSKKQFEIYPIKK